MVLNYNANALVEKIGKLGRGELFTLNAHRHTKGAWRDLL